ncbi:hypothetical protein [Rhodococcus opacus]|uniref:hypothetical protein n=1 Tax=Rhodococcus opacus TaxID=37919 RepID=UPI001CED27A1|nr:hypothetical protein [Rhodococcus opacus]
MTTRSATRIAGRGEIDPADPASARPPLRAVREFLEQLTRTPDRVDAVGVADLPVPRPLPGFPACRREDHRPR